jgi:hypothetical protein
MVTKDLEELPQRDTKLDTSTPDVSRVYDYLTGGKDNYAADRATGEHVLQISPAARALVREALAFRARALTDLAPAVVLDLGSGLPSPHFPIHEVCHGARILYVDHLATVRAHLRALFNTVDVYGMDVTQPAELWKYAPLTDTLTQPLTVVITMLLHFVHGDDAARMIDQLAHLLAPGSNVICSLGVADEETATDLAGAYNAADTYNHPPADVANWFTQAGFSLQGPGLCHACDWQPNIPAAEHLPTITGLKILALVATRGHAQT